MSVLSAERLLELWRLLETLATRQNCHPRTDRKAIDLCWPQSRGCFWDLPVETWAKCVFFDLEIWRNSKPFIQRNSAENMNISFDCALVKPSPGVWWRMLGCVTSRTLCPTWMCSLTMHIRLIKTKYVPLSCAVEIRLHSLERTTQRGDGWTFSILCVTVSVTVHQIS